MHPRVIIVGTVPYNKQSSSRAFDAYFHFWEKENIAQFFSNSMIPTKGHCGELYQVTDKQMLQRWFHKTNETGIIFKYDFLQEVDYSVSEEESVAIKKAYSIGSRHTAFTHLLRGILWRKKYWCTEKFNKWIENFNPECVFLAFSNDYFIPQIAYYIAKKFNIPIVSCIGDDYYFDVHFSLNPFYLIYKYSYRSLIRKVLSYKGSAIYISDKIRDKYNHEFHLDGETVYLTSTVKRKPFSKVDTKRPLITYFGNIRMGRNNSLSDIADALGEIDDNYRIEVYSAEADSSFYGVIEKNPHAIWGGLIPYELVQTKMQNSDITIVVEGFDERDIEKSRYSLSTKAADALASGAAILAYGSQECGIIEYLQSTKAAMVCTQKSELKGCICKLLNDEVMQKSFYDKQIVISKDNHTLEKSCQTSEKVIRNAMKK